MDRWRLLSHDDVGAADGLAFDEALMAAYARGAPARAPTLRLYTYRSHVALVGRFQHLEAELRVDACRHAGTEFNRRPTGGGAIVMGAGQLGVAVVTRAPAAQRPKELLERFSTGIVAGLEELGIEARFRGKNDLEVAGRKIAGLGLYLDGAGGMLFHSSVLADLDIGFMLEVLSIPAAKLGDQAAEAVAQRVTTVTRETGEAWSGRRLREVIAVGFAKSLDLDLVAGRADPAEEAEAARLVGQKYATDEWLFQRTPHADANGSAVFKTGAGLVRLYLALSGGTIKSALLTGDFNDLPPTMTRFEEALRWKALDAGVVGRLVGDTGVAEDLGIDGDELVAAVMTAGAQARQREIAAPERLEGSCYFPEKGVRT